MALSATYFHVFRPSCIIASPLAPRYAFNDPPTNNLPSHAPYLNTRQSRLISLPGSVLTTPPYSTRIGDLNASTRQPLNASMPSKPQQRQQCNAAAAPQRLNTPTPQSFNNYPTTLVLMTSTLQQVSASTLQQYQQCNATATTQHIDVNASKPQYPALILKYSILNALPVPCRKLTSRHQTSPGSTRMHRHVRALVLSR